MQVLFTKNCENIFTKRLAICESNCYNVSCCNLIIKPRLFKEVPLKWQNANIVVKTLLSASRFLTHTDVQTELGSPTLKE